MKKETRISALWPGASIGLGFLVACGIFDKSSEAPQQVDDAGSAVAQDAGDDVASFPSSDATPPPSDATFGQNADAASSCSGTQPGCLCATVGQTEACWTGPANQRHVGACRDGTTTCTHSGEFAQWSACVGQVLNCVGDGGMPPPPPPQDAGFMPPPQSCLPGSSLSALITGTNVTVYVPVGSWDETGTGVNVVPIEGAGFDGTGKTTVIATPNTVNTCAGNSVTGKVVCTSNGNDVYVIAGATLSATLTSAGDSSESFSGGTCKTCNVAIDPSQNKAFLSIGVGGSAAFQPLDLGSNVLGAPIPSGQTQTSEALLVDTVRGFVLSPNERSDYQLVNTANGQVFDSFFTSESLEFDSPGEDCTTGIALGTNEESGSRLLLVDLTQLKFSLSPDGGLPIWSAPYNVQTIPEFATFNAGSDGIAVASNSHIGVITGEFGGNTFGAFVLPPSAGTGTPALVDWVEAAVPATPDSVAFNMGTDPHTVTAYTSPANGKPYAIFEDDTSSGSSTTRTFLAIVDLTGLLARPRSKSDSALTHTLATPLGAADTCVGTPGSLAPNPSGCIVRFVHL
jgi:hypothetical protein